MKASEGEYRIALQQEVIYQEGDDERRRENSVRDEISVEGGGSGIDQREVIERQEHPVHLIRQFRF